MGEQIMLSSHHFLMSQAEAVFIFFQQFRNDGDVVCPNILTGFSEAKINNIY